MTMTYSFVGAAVVCIWVLFARFGDSCFTGNNPEEHEKCNQCFKRFNSSCTKGELKCAGGPSALFVYKIESAASGAGSNRRHYIPRPRQNYKKNLKAYKSNSKSHDYKTQPSKRKMFDATGLEDILAGIMGA